MKNYSNIPFSFLESSNCFSQKLKTGDMYVHKYMYNLLLIKLQIIWNPTIAKHVFDFKDKNSQDTS